MIKFRVGFLPKDKKLINYDKFIKIKKEILKNKLLNDDVKMFIEKVNKMEELLEGDASEATMIRHAGGWKNIIFE